ncbi:hypothetical protein [Flavobacterium cerinum]|uniref:Lipocalin-like domain-containing protein n=1 Tax=Flavobacterium cerinum TaxID=2502784 RepID=A0ABY5IPW8_9FLAO|nr:hypothetical protein [Flavobacterium cerinum]UUC44845.1 hypothetical protein NOX80_14565 [Flavobacterium cerinum]
MKKTLLYLTVVTLLTVACTLDIDSTTSTKASEGLFSSKMSQNKKRFIDNMHDGVWESTEGHLFATLIINHMFDHPHLVKGYYTLNGSTYTYIGKLGFPGRQDNIVCNIKIIGNTLTLMVESTNEVTRLKKGQELTFTRQRNSLVVD